MDESEFNLSHFTFYAGLENILSLQRLHLHVRQKLSDFYILVQFQIWLLARKSTEVIAS